LENRNKQDPVSDPRGAAESPVNRLSDAVLGGVGNRIYLVRLGLGDGMRTPMPMRKFATLLTDDLLR
jgi:hypothetical protein